MVVLLLVLKNRIDGFCNRYGVARSSTDLPGCAPEVGISGH